LQLLYRQPSAVIAVFPQMFHDQADVLQVPDPGFRVTEPETFRMGAHQFMGSFDEPRRNWNGSHHFDGILGL